MSHNSILMIGWEYPPHNSGGLGVACEGMTKALADIGHQIYFTLPHNFVPPTAHMQIIPCYDETWVQNGPGALLSAYAKVGVKKNVSAFELQTLPQSELEHRVEEYADHVWKNTLAINSNVGVIHAHDWMSFPAAEKLHDKTGLPFVAHVHSTEYDRIPDGNGSPYIMAREKEGLEKADRVIAVSNFTRQIIAAKYGIPLSKIDVVHNGTEPIQGSTKSETNFAPGQPVVVFMGRLTMQKGGETFLNVAQLVSKVMPDTLFVMAGDGDMYQSLLLKGANQGLTAKLLFTGFIRDKKRDELLNRANVFVMPSVSEPFGLVALEAAQRQTPVIISRSSGVQEVLPHSIAVDFWDTELIAKKIIDIIKQPKMAAKIVVDQNEDLKNINWQSSAAKINDIFRQSFLGKSR